MPAFLIPRAIVGSLLVPLGLSAQVAPRRDLSRPVQWPAPLYWQPDGARPQTAYANPGPVPEALVFIAMTPCRVVDTRAASGITGAFGPPSLAAAAVRTFPMQQSTTCTIPFTAEAYSLNVTVVPDGYSVYFLTLYPAVIGTQPGPPNVSTLNDPAGGILANAAVVQAGTDGAGGIDAYATGPTDLIIDINGYYAPPQGLNGNLGLGFAALSENTTGSENTAVGSGALDVNTTGNANTAIGAGALGVNTSGSQNTATGNGALFGNTTGGNNTADGYMAMQINTTGSNNTATGAMALQANTSGTQNTATGSSALLVNTTGYGNTGTGYITLVNNTTGSGNTATGYYAMQGNTSGSGNTATGGNTMLLNTTGLANTATGSGALNDNSSGSFNTAEGYYALQMNTTGGNNIAIGAMAASDVAGAGGFNIHIGSKGASGDNNTIRIGSSQLQFFAAGIRGATTGSNDAIPVMIDSNGQLGTVSSSARFKEDIRDMGDASSGLLRLRPVTFRYKQSFTDGSKPVQYGLIAEEVEKVMPELVAHSADGQIESVKYQMLDSLLLNELQKALEKIRLLEDRLAAVEASIH